MRGLVALVAVLGCALAAAAPAAQASLSVPTGGPATAFSGTGTAGVAGAIGQFEAAAGGGDNGAVAGEQGSGFRHVNWDQVLENVIPVTGHVFQVPSTTLELSGLDLSQQIAVANDGFTSVNPNAAGLFGPFSQPNIWAPFNGDTTEMHIVAPAPVRDTPAPAQSRGLGIVFLNVRLANTTQIQYYNGDILLGQVFAPVGATSFAGLLFPAAAVNRVVITLGSAQIFGFDGATVTPGGPDSGANNLVAADDIVLGEPAPARPAIATRVGAGVADVLDTFTDTDPNANTGNFTATIDWGDGTRTSGTISKLPGGTFQVTGFHAYAQPGTYTATVTVGDFSSVEQTTQTQIRVGPNPTTTTVSCSPASVAVSASASCQAVVTEAAAAAPSYPAGTVTFSSPTASAAFPVSGSCTLGSTAVQGTSLCSVQFSPGQLPPSQARITATYGGDAVHAGSTAATLVGVHRPRCTLKALSRRLRAGGFALVATCEARTNVQITAQAHASRQGGRRAFQVRFGSIRFPVSAGRPTVLVIKAAHGVLPALRAALHRHQRVSLKLTLTASTQGIRRSTTTRVSALRGS